MLRPATVHDVAAIEAIVQARQLTRRETHRAEEHGLRRVYMTKHLQE